MIGQRYRGQKKKQTPSYSRLPSGEEQPLNRKAFKLALRQMKLKQGSKKRGSKIQKVDKEFKIKLARLKKRQRKVTRSLSSK